MKLFLAYLVVLFALAFADKLELKRTAESDDKNRFEAKGLVSSDEIKKRGYICATSCESGQVTSKYCTTAAKYCFGNGQVVDVRFGTAFKAPPKVTVGLTRIDTHKDQNVRVHVQVESITTSGFNIRFKPWDYSITYQLGINWMACP
ncbi:uncharacterized protein LOC114517108 [Dendronephthya gigantea]|uniref:uncharacterized protein LOC114517108 n=1 Tax=Dendronephthya gigantea TaxID=151771 RepID=UPI001069BAD9|nr:uncharacterized protein LOC114517108 [Dendronephthya gigantea]